MKAKARTRAKQAARTRAQRAEPLTIGYLTRIDRARERLEAKEALGAGLLISKPIALQTDGGNVNGFDVIPAPDLRSSEDVIPALGALIGWAHIAWSLVGAREAQNDVDSLATLLIGDVTKTLLYVRDALRDGVVGPSRRFVDDSTREKLVRAVASILERKDSDLVLAGEEAALLLRAGARELRDAEVPA